MEKYEWGPVNLGQTLVIVKVRYLIIEYLPHDGADSSTTQHRMHWRIWHPIATKVTHVTDNDSNSRALTSHGS